MYRAGNGFGPTVIPGANRNFPFWMFGYQDFGGFFKRTSGVLFIVPLTGADVFEKPRNFFFRFKNLTIEVTWIPVNQNGSQVENDSVNFIIHVQCKRANVLMMQFVAKKNSW